MAQTALLENGERPDQRDRNLFDALRVPHDFVAELAKRAPLDMLPDLEGAALKTAMIDKAGDLWAVKLRQNGINARVRFEARLEVSEQPDLSGIGAPGKKELRFGRRWKFSDDLPIADAAVIWLWRGPRRRPDPFAACEAHRVVWLHGVTVGAAGPVRLWRLGRGRLRFWGRLLRRMLFDRGRVNVE